MNRLSTSTSLYLQQHADNPVAWQPWDDAALQQAKELDRPILLSIGYSACHWCHVMAHESFEDQETARWMNELFVNIKIDREERPDLDRVYQLSHQLLTGRGGGWPLTVFLDPRDLTPFFAGTYFPPSPRHGLPSFTELIKKVRQWFDEHRDQVQEQNQRLAGTIASLQGTGGGDSMPGEALFGVALAQLQQRYDDRNGGFGGAPKFPQAPLLGLVQALSKDGAEGENPASGMLQDTLTRMALSGLRDHLDGGFFRYTVDGYWTIPHFEKMLYDNALLLPLYAETAQRDGDPLLREAAEGIVTWLGTEMRHENGGFFASIDADAAGEEGGFHVWQRDEIRELLDDSEYAAAAAAFGLDAPPNFEDTSWHLTRQATPGAEAPPASALEKLRAARTRRTPPGTDTKQLTSWNALCVEGLSRAGMALGRSDWLDLAEDALAFLRSTLWRDGILYAVYAGDRVQFPAYLDDYAYLLNAILVLLQERWNPENLEFAMALATTMLDEFNDPEHGGFYFSSDKQQVPIHRMRPMQDDATPGGNGIAASALLRLAHLTGETRFLAAAEATLGSAAAGMEDHPLAHAALMNALDQHLHPATQVIITGSDPREVNLFQAVAREAAGRHHRVNFYAFGPEGGKMPGILGAHKPGRGTAAYVCKGLQCLPPVETAEALANLLGPSD